MEQTMMLSRRTKRKLKASLGTYVIILFGLSVMLYMFGFTNIYDKYTSQNVALGSEGGNVQINNPNVSKSQEQGGGIFNNVMMLVIGVVTGLLALSVLTYIISSYFTRGGGGTSPTQQTVNLIFPMILLIVVTNVFIFPIADIQQYTAGMDVGNLNISLVLVAFLNLWLILGIVEYMRGTQI